MKISHYSFRLTVFVLLVFHSQSLFAELTLLRSSESSLVPAIEENSASPLVITSVIMQPVTISDTSPSSNLVIEEPVLVLDTATEVKIEGKLLNYPNPFSYSSGSTSIGYFLTKSGDIRLQIYSLTGYLLYTADFAKDSPGAEGNTYNRIQLDKFSFGSAVLSPGVYLYTIIHNGKLLGKNRMVVLP